MTRTIWLLIPLLAGCAGSADGTCVREKGGAPATIEETVDLINRLPMPVTIPCLMESLDRPLSIETTTDQFSAQPAAGELLPRIFVRNGDLSLSVAPAGEGRPLLEFAMKTSSTHSIKAELEFPIEAPVDYAAPYERVAVELGGTNCGLCHGEERQVEPGVFESRAFKPLPETTGPLEPFVASLEDCDPLEDDACHVMTSVFGHGDVVRRPFPEHYPTLYDFD